MPSRIYLSVPLMWDILQFNCMADSREISTTGLLDTSLALTVTECDEDDNSTLDIIVATSPEITVNTADGGQDAPTTLYNGAVLTSAANVRSAALNDISTDQADRLTFNTTPLLYADPLNDIEYMDLHYHEPSGGDTNGPAWWEGGNIGDSFSHI